MTSFNRNFRGRNDALDTLSFIASPEIVTAYAVTGSLAEAPHLTKITGSDDRARFLPKPQAPELPEQVLFLIVRF